MPGPDERQRESLPDEARAAIEEVRTVLPGMQALFGFQLIAIFNESFRKLPHAAQIVHLTALLIVAVSIVLVMAPAAFHRIGERGWVSRRLVDLTSNFLTAGMALLIFALSLEVGLLSSLVLENNQLAAIFGAAIFVLSTLCWIVSPLRYRARYRPR